MALNPALWVLSRGLCKKMWQNHTKDSGRIIFDIDTLVSNHGYWPKDYVNPCWYCPINAHCVSAIPSNPYYRYGYLVKLEKFFHPQTAIVFPSDLSLNYESQASNDESNINVKNKKNLTKGEKNKQIKIEF